MCSAAVALVKEVPKKKPFLEGLMVSAALELLLEGSGCVVTYPVARLIMTHLDEELYCCMLLIADNQVCPGLVNEMRATLIKRSRSTKTKAHKGAWYASSSARDLYEDILSCCAALAHTQRHTPSEPSKLLA